MPIIDDSVKAAIEILEEKSAQLHGGPLDVHMYVNSMFKQKFSHFLKAFC